nr:reverse transcriptase domain-containing protein [Tanacetum cinerariifolium]
MPPRNGRKLSDVYEQEFKQHVVARIEERLDQFVDQLADRMNGLMSQERRGGRNHQEYEDEEQENPFGDGDDSSSNEHSKGWPKQNQREDSRRWESRIRVNIPEFNGDTLNPEGFID